MIGASVIGPSGRRAGFTLMELLVALALFSITSALLADIFVTVSRQQVRTRMSSRVQGDARLVLEMIARELRDGTVDYTGLTDNILALRDADGRGVQFQRAVDDCPQVSPACIRMGRENADGSFTWAPLTAAGVDVRAFVVLVAPSVDPYAWDPVSGNYAADEPSRVTVRVDLVATSGRPIDRPAIEAQTTVASRVYRR